MIGSALTLKERGYNYKEKRMQHLTNGHFTVVLREDLLRGWLPQTSLQSTKARILINVSLLFISHCSFSINCLLVYYNTKINKIFNYLPNLEYTCTI